jgi:hypothetical protein
MNNALVSKAMLCAQWTGCKICNNNPSARLAYIGQLHIRVHVLRMALQAQQAAQAADLASRYARLLLHIKK